MPSRDWCPDPLPADAPLYVALADAIAADLARGRLRPGDQLPTHRALARRLGINVMTVTRGYAEAARSGLVEGESGRGTYVRGQGRPANDFLPPPEDGGPRIDFHFNLPAGDPTQLDLGGTLAELAAEPERALLFTGYHALGLDPHRALGARWMARAGVPERAGQVVVTGGAQHAMLLAVLSRTTPGDLLLVEELSYPGMKGLAAALSLRIAGVAMDGHGILPDALDQACRRGEPRLCYLMPNLHNPLGRVMPEARRREVVLVARRHGLTLLEDDTYGFLVDEPPPPLAALAPELTLFVTGFSKSLAAGLRVGFLRAPEGEEPEDRIAAYVAATSWMAAPLLAELARRFVEGGAADRMVAWKRYEARARRELADAALAQDRPGRRLDAYAGSSHVWLPLAEPWTPEAFCEAARARGVLVSPAAGFHTGRGTPPRALRVCLGTPGSRDEVARGLAVLGRLHAQGPELAHPLV